jgi:hypothetical protein
VTNHVGVGIVDAHLQDKTNSNRTWMRTHSTPTLQHIMRGCSSLRPTPAFTHCVGPAVQAHRYARLCGALSCMCAGAWRRRHPHACVLAPGAGDTLMHVPQLVCWPRVSQAVRVTLTIWYLPLRSASLPASVISNAFMSGSWLKGTLSLGICTSRQQQHTYAGYASQASKNDSRPHTRQTATAHTQMLAAHHKQGHNNSRPHAWLRSDPWCASGHCCQVHNQPPPTSRYVSSLLSK